MNKSIVICLLVNIIALMMRTSKNGIEFIRSFEGLRLEAYQCSAKIWTIGWGTTCIMGRKVHKGDCISVQQADEYFKIDLYKYEQIVNQRIIISLRQNQFDALVSHTYNTGGSDTLFDLINSKASETKIQAWFEGTYITANGIKINGLIRRRKAEASLYFR